MTRGGQARDLDTVHARHDDIGQQQVPFLVQNRDRLFAVGAGGHLIAGALQGAAQEAAQRVVIFGEENSGHGRSARRQS